MRRVGEQGNLGRCIGEVASEASGGYSDIGQLFGGRLGDDAAIGEEEDPVAAEAGFFGFENEHGRYRFHAGLPWHRLEDGAEARGSVGGGARNEGVGASRGHHDAREVTGVLD